MVELERYSPVEGGQNAHEHLHRYAFASEFVSDRVVLDIASGEGYGSSIIASHAKMTYGVDIDADVVAAAREKYGEIGRLEFLVASADAIPLANGSVDIVVSFETIEHLVDPTKFIGEVRRVLRSGGIFIVSSPNRKIYNVERRGVANPFHLHEMDRAEFETSLDTFFPHRRTIGQRMTIASSLSDLTAETPIPTQYRGYFGEYGNAHRLSYVDRGVIKIPSPSYYIAVCSDQPVELLRDIDSIFMLLDSDLWIEHSKKLRWASQLHDEDEKLRSYVADMRVEVASTVGQLTEERAHNEKLRMQLEAGNEEGARNRKMLQRLSNALLTVASASHELAERTGEGSPTRIALDYDTRQKIVRQELAVLDSLVARITGQNSEATVPTLVDLLSGWASVDNERNRIAAEATDEVRQLQLKMHRIEAERNSIHEELSTTRDELQGALLEAQNVVSKAERYIEHLETELATVREKQAEAQEVGSKARQAFENLQNEFTALKSHLSKEISAVDVARETTANLLAEQIALNNGLEQELEKERDDSQFALRIAEIELKLAGLNHNFIAVRDRAAVAIAARAVNQTLTGQVLSAKVALPSNKNLLAAYDKLFELKLFDPNWYARKVGLSEPGASTDHFLKYGLVEGRSPHGLFDIHYVRRQLGMDAQEPLVLAFLAAINTSDISPSPMFHPQWYRAQVGEHFSGSAYAHYVHEGRQKGISPHPLIDAVFFAKHTGREFDLSEFACEPVLWAEQSHLLFDNSYYMNENSDVIDAGVNPLGHYLMIGWREGRKPNRLFDPYWYIGNNPDILAADIEPLTHYVDHGAREGRRPHALFDAVFYTYRYPDIGRDGTEPFAHFIVHGYQERRMPAIEIASLIGSSGLSRPEAINRLVDVAFGVAEPRGARIYLTADEIWPPPTVGDRWMPTRLREYLEEVFGSAIVPLYAYLMSVVMHYADAGVEFDKSEHCHILIARARKLALRRRQETPQVSIIIPAFNNLLYTLTATISVLETNTASSYEIIVADDCSEDATAEAISAIGGNVRHLRGPNNLGFLKNCNEAAKSAGGRYVVFLNNDTLVLPGWLDTLVHTFNLDNKIGFVGSKLINGDGTLQEAGGIFWRDGTAWNFGRNQNPSLPEFNYLKDVDYVSGASIMLPMKIWQELGGFDELYLPAYCEDSDLAFRVRAAGYRTVYQPRSEIIHHEGRSHGTDFLTGIKSYQVINQKKLIMRWHDVLDRDHFANGENVIFARDRSADKPRILIIDHYVPQWDRDAGSRTMYHYIRLFAENGFHVIFWPDNLYRDPDYTPKLQDMGVEIIYSNVYFDNFSGWMTANGPYLNYTLLSRPSVSEKYIDTINEYKHIKKIYYGHDLHFLRLRQQYMVNPSEELLIEADWIEKIERKICGMCDVVLYPSQDEIDVVAQWQSTAILQAVPMTLFDEEEIAAGRARAERLTESHLRHLMFVGGFSHKPNEDGILWFLSEVMPYLAAADSGFVLSIAGSNTPDKVKSYASENVRILGRISDEELSELYEQSGISVVPLRFGAGVKGKVIEAMAMGVPVIMTNVGAQGIPSPERFAIIADQPRDLAVRILHMREAMSDVQERTRAALNFIDDAYSVRAAERLLAAFIPELARNERGKRP